MRTKELCTIKKINVHMYVVTLVMRNLGATGYDNL
jgi:hypothetical protein